VRQVLDRPARIFGDLNSFQVYSFLRLAGIPFNEQATGSRFPPSNEVYAEAHRTMYFSVRDFPVRRQEMLPAGRSLFSAHLQGGAKEPASTTSASICPDAQKARLRRNCPPATPECPTLDPIGWFNRLDRATFWHVLLRLRVCPHSGRLWVNLRDFRG